MTGFRALPPVDRLAAALDAPRAVAVRPPRGRCWPNGGGKLHAGAQDEPDLIARARARACASGAAAVAAPRHQRHRRDRPHQPGPRAARRRRRVERVAERAARLLQPRVRPRRAARAAARHDHVEALLCRAHRRRGRDRRQQQRRRDAARRWRRSRPGREVIVSRGQLVEIGGGFRVPDVIGAVRRAAASRSARPTAPAAPTTSARSAADTGAILRVHPSNFRQLGFVQEVEIEELCELGVPP